MKNDAHESGAGPEGAAGPLLVVAGWTLPGATRKSEVRVPRGPVLCTEDAAELIPALLLPVPAEGASLRLCGSNPQELLRSGQVGYIPRVLPAAQTLAVRSALRSSVALIGGERTLVDEALGRCGLEGLAKRRLGQLSTAEQRLVGIAHGWCGQPRVLLIEDLLSDLDDQEAGRVDAVLVQITAGRDFVMAGSTRNTAARLWWGRVEQVLFPADGVLAGPVRPTALQATSHWVTTYGAADELYGALLAQKFHATRGPHDKGLFVLASAAQIVQAAASCRAKIVALTPSHYAPFASERAKAGA